MLHSPPIAFVVSPSLLFSFLHLLPSVVFWSALFSPPQDCCVYHSSRSPPAKDGAASRRRGYCQVGVGITAATSVLENRQRGTEILTHSPRSELGSGVGVFLPPLGRPQREDEQRRTFMMRCFLLRASEEITAELFIGQQSNVANVLVRAQASVCMSTCDSVNYQPPPPRVLL